jgi:glycosyltransferase involved in cell wall biosynthesis
MRICIIGKFPPIQGGVSMRTYWTAHGLAARGHEVHVVTNAKEVRPPFRMFMRAEDWKLCEATYREGSVTVHWTDPVDRSQSYIPMASPLVSKLAAIAARVHAGRPFDVILSHYMEPYGVAAHLAAGMTGAPHVARMAGSDAGRLWHHPQLETLYDHVLRSAEVMVAAGPVAERAIERGVDPDRIAFGGGFVVPEDLFTPDGPVLDLTTLRSEVEQDAELGDLVWGGFTGDRPYFAVCGKLGESKGSFVLLAAMQRLKRAGLAVGLVALAHGGPAIDASFRSRAQKLGLADRILQIPFLPHWRVPELLRGALAVCCLEQDFPIGFHSPIIPREILLCGSCLVGSTEVIRKLPGYGRLAHGYGCVAIEDVNDVDALSARLAAIVDDPGPAAAVGARGCAFARELQRDVAFPQTLERILDAAAARRRVPTAARVSADDSAAESRDGRPPLPQVSTAALEASDPLFRLRIKRWAMGDGDLPALVPVRDQELRVVEFDRDALQSIGIPPAVELPAVPTTQRSYLVTFAASDDEQRDPLLVDALTARILELSDGTRTAAEIIGQLDHSGPSATDDNLMWIERLFLCGLIRLQDTRVVPAFTGSSHPSGLRDARAPGGQPG